MLGEKKYAKRDICIAMERGIRWNLLGKMGAREDENMKEWDGQWGKLIEWESNEKEVLIKRVNMGLGRKLVLDKFPRICKDQSS